MLPECTCCTADFRIGSDLELTLEELAMHEILVALAFVAMVACPAIVAAMPQHEEDEA